MYIIFCIRSCDKEKNIYRFLIKCFEINSIFYYHCRKSRLVDTVAFSVRNSYSFSYSCGAFFFTCIHQFFISFFVFDLSAFRHKIYGQIQRFTFRLRCRIKTYTLLIKKFYYLHSLLLLLYSTVE